MNLSSNQLKSLRHMSYAYRKFIILIMLAFTLPARADFLDNLISIVGAGSETGKKIDQEESFDEDYFADYDFSAFKAISGGVEGGLPGLDITTKNFDPEETWQKFAENLTKRSELIRQNSLQESSIDIFTKLASWESVKHLNFAAKAVWENLLECNGSDPNQARNRYFDRSVCPDEEAANSLRQEIVILHKNIYNLLKTGTFYLPKAQKRGPAPANGFAHIIRNMQLEMAGQPTDLSYTDSKVSQWREVNEITKPNFHPMFSQIVIEYLSVINRIVNGSMSQPFGISDIGSNEVLLDYPFYNLTTVLRPSELAYWSELKEEGLLDEESTYTTSRIFVNTWLLFSLVAKDSCVQLGLWPELSIGLLQLLLGQREDYSREVARVINQVTCKKRPAINREWRMEPFNLHEIDILVAYRLMGNQYGFELYKKTKCLYGARISDYFAPKRYMCFTEDPFAPDDMDTGFKMARGGYNDKVQRLLDALNFIGRQ